MLGDLVYEGKGRTICVRMLDNKGTKEITTQEEGSVLGIPCTLMVTFVSTHRPDGTEYSEGQGVLYTKDGDSASLNVSCVLIPKGIPPSGNLRGATFFGTQSPKLARLNTVATVFEAEMKEDMSYTVKDWEWK
ncbi:MAG: hypothetical protein ACM3MI_11400 [Clostridiales bacterium]